jgi:Ca2+-binding EF-hand superfamily protein
MKNSAVRRFATTFPRRFGLAFSSSDLVCCYSGAFDLYDADHNGAISRAEMLSIIESIYKMIEEQGDVDNPKMSAEARVDEIFKTMDTVRGPVWCFEVVSFAI